ncbi:uncharacterized protein [Dermacentor albipictus]|uniref:uncharacterized protein isoform X2 n=1 Tax=Dermacentor albipictus TaxID=60249 RepID=UPI0031FBFDB2
MAGTSSSGGGSGSSSSVQPPRTLPPTPRFKSFSSSCLHSPTTELHTYSDVSPTDLATTPTWQERPASRFVFSISPPRASSCLGNQSPQEYRPLCAASGDGERARGGRGVRGGGLGTATKEDEDEDVSRKARWIIITTAVSLFVMSVLLVGIMLRLAPVIDDLVRKENENLFRLPTSTATTTTTGGTVTATATTTFASDNATLTAPPVAVG